VPIIVEPLLNERCMGEWNLRSWRHRTVAGARHGSPGRRVEQVFVARITEALERFQTLLPLNPLIVSSKAVARVLNILLAAAAV